MKSNPTDDDLLRSYLLGELPEEEAEHLERRLLAEDELFELSEAVEADLLAACARGELAPAERERVQQRLASSPRGRERLALARALNTLAGSSEPAAAPVIPFLRRAATPARPAFRWAALAAALLAAAGLSWYAMERPHGGEAPSWVAQERPAPASPRASEAPRVQKGAPAAKPEPVKAVFQLALMSLRGAEAAQKLRVRTGTDVVELQIGVEGMDDLQTFHLTLRNRKSEMVWERDGLEPVRLDGVRALVVDLPADRLPAGTYEIQARGLTHGGEPEDLSPLEIEVVREGRS
jgi:anti-sigma factor RsiW